MFERFTERARQVVVLAQEEARTLKHNYIGTEHILLGLLREEEGLAARVLESSGQSTLGMSTGPSLSSGPPTVSSGGASGSSPLMLPWKVNWAASPSPSVSTSTI